jgi:hypothetical protein
MLRERVEGWNGLPRLVAWGTRGLLEEALGDVGPELGNIGAMWVAVGGPLAHGQHSCKLR